MVSDGGINSPVSSGNEDPNRLSSGFAAQLDRLLTESTRTLRDVASSAGTSASTISSWRTGRHLPYPRQHAVVAALLGELGVDDPAPWLDQLMNERTGLRRPIGPNPFQGLAPYDEEHSSLFFGRDVLIDELWEQINARITGTAAGPIVLIGASGSGKTSVLRAGLTSRLADNSVTAHYVAAEASSRLEGPVGLDEEVGAPSRVLIVDQFETVLGDAPLLASAAVDRLARETSAGRVVVIGLRADHYHLALEHGYLAEALRHPVIPDLMNDDGIADVIELPAQKAHMTVEPSLTRQLLADFGDQVRAGRTGEVLPLLSHVLFRLSEAPDAREITLARYHEVGGLEGALLVTAEETFADLDEDGRLVCEHLCTNLVEIGRDDLPVRRRAQLSDLFGAAEADGSRSTTEKVIEKFVEQRMLTLERNTVSLSHEALLRAWPRLAAWIESYRESLAALRRIRSAHEAWLANDRDTGSLLAGAELDVANRLTEDPTFNPQLNDSERSFVSTSKAAAERAASRRLLAFKAAIGIAVIASALLAVTYLSFTRAQRSGAEAESRQLSLQSLNLSETEPALSAQLAVAAEARASTTESRSALIAASGQMSSGRYLGQPGATALAVTPDGSRLAFSDSVDGRIVLMERTGDGYQQVAAINLDDPTHDVYGLDISPDGRLVAYGGTDLYANIWDTETDGREVLDDTLTVFQGAVQSVRFSSDGSRVLASGTSDGGAGQWEVGAGPTQSTLPLVGEAGSIMSIDLNEAAGLIATGNDNGEVALWSSADSGEPLWTFSAEAEPSALAVAFNPGGDTLAVGFRDGTLMAWDVSRPDAPAPLDVEFPSFSSWTSAVAFSPSGQSLVAASSDGQARVWDTAEWRPRGTALPHANGVTNAEFIDDDALVLSLADGSVRTWDLGHPHMAVLGAPIWSVTFTNDGSLALATTKERSALWDVSEDGNFTLRTDGLTSPDPDLQLTGESRFGPDGSVASGTFQGEVLIMSLDGEEFEIDRRLVGAESLIEALEYSPDGATLAALGNQGELVTWSLGSTDDMATSRFLSETILFNLAFDPSGELLAVTDSDGLLRLFDIGVDGEATEVSSTKVATDSASGVMFHPTERVVAVGSHDSTLSLWDVSDSMNPVEVDRLSGPNGRIHDVRFDGSGDRLGASTSAGEAWIWDTNDLSAATLDARIVGEGQMYTFTFPPYSDVAVGAGTDQRITRWLLDPALASAERCSNLGEPITQEEWNALVPGLDFFAPC